MKVDFTTIARGDDSGYRTANQMTIESKERWADVWRKHVSDIIPPPPIPKVDFAKEMVIAVFAGEKPTSGYSVNIVAIETQRPLMKERPLLVVKIKHRQPSKGEVVMDVLTQPYHIVKISKIEFSQVVFEQA